MPDKSLKIACETCKYWDIKLVQNMGTCRVNPPVIFGLNDLANWPITKDLDWCGKWVMK